MSWFKSIILITIFFTWIQLSFGSDNELCLHPGKIKYILNKKEMIQNENFCYIRKNNYFFSINCNENKTNCLALTSIKQVSEKFELFNNGIGSPGFNLCYQLKGVPQLISFYDGLIWHSGDRCFFQKDSSFIDTGNLIKLWSHRNEN